VGQPVRLKKGAQGRGASGFGHLHEFRLANQTNAVKVNHGVEVS
jgi:hypothetical protein